MWNWLTENVLICQKNFETIQKTILISLKIILIRKKIFLKLFKMASNQTRCSRIEQRSFIKCLLSEKCKTCNLSKKYMTCTKKNVLLKKMFTNGINIALFCMANTLDFYLFIFFI